MFADSDSNPILFVSGNAVAIGSDSTNDATFSIVGNDTDDILTILDSNDDVSLSVDKDGDVLIGTEFSSGYALTVGGVVSSVGELTSSEVLTALEGYSDHSPSSGFLAVTENGMSFWYFFFNVMESIVNWSDMVSVS